MAGPAQEVSKIVQISFKRAFIFQSNGKWLKNVPQAHAVINTTKYVYQKERGTIGFKTIYENIQ